MNNKLYKSIVKKNLKRPNHLKNYFYGFLFGGTLGLSCETVFLILKKITHMSSLNIRSLISLTIIFIASLLTSIGILDKLITKYRSGIIIPTTGFAHSITSSAIDMKKDGAIKGVGSAFFSLAGSVILYATISSFVLIIVKVIINA